MATTHRRTVIANGIKRKNRARRKLTRAQKLAGFGGKRAQSAAKHRKRNSAPPKKNRKRNVARKRNAAPKRNAAKANKHRRRTNTAKPNRRHKRRNAGRVVEFTLGPKSNGRAQRRNGKMATTTRKNKHHRPKHHRSGHRVKHHRRNGVRRNPFGGGWSQDIMNGLFVIAGAVGAKLGTQMVLGSNNTGVMGYAGNLAVGGALALGTKALLKNGRAAAAVFSGAVVEVLIRVINDYTPFGQYVSGLGMGDYFASNWVAPQRYVDALNSAQVQIPQGWAPPTIVQSAAPPAGMSGMYDNSSSLY